LLRCLVRGAVTSPGVQPSVSDRRDKLCKRRGMEIGESLVGAYMRQVRGCHTVAFNIHLPQQGELDVVGVANGAHGVEVGGDFRNAST
jgi:hypothetical protein